jgi:hypothetical protein
MRRNYQKASANGRGGATPPGEGSSEFESRCMLQYLQFKVAAKRNKYADIVATKFPLVYINEGQVHQTCQDHFIA